MRYSFSQTVFACMMTCLCLWGAARLHAEDLDWTRRTDTATAPVVEDTAEALEAGVFGQAVGEVTEVAGSARVLVIDEQSGVAPRKLQVGDALHAGERLEVAANSAIEIGLGLNARLRIGADSVVLVDQIAQEAKPRGVVEMMRRFDVEKGEARVRVRRNLRTPSTVFLVAGTVSLVVKQSDAVLSKVAGATEIKVLSGAANVMLRKQAIGDKAQKGTVVSSNEKLTFKRLDGKQVPTLQTMTEEEVDKIRRRMMFSVDRELDQLPPPPPDDTELDGP